VSEKHKILVVDDTPHNVKLLADLFSAHGYAVSTAASGPEALERIGADLPDLVLLDVVMPGMDGYEVCRSIRERPETKLLPVVIVTALDPAEERLKGIEAGADDFLTKPIQMTEVLARTRSLLRIRDLHETVRRQASQLAEWNGKLEERVEQQVQELRRLERLKRFFSPQIAEVVAGDQTGLLQPHRRDVTVVFIDLRGFTSFTQLSEPEDLMTVLREYHAEMGRLIVEHEGTLERFTGDGIMIFFNDPFEVPNAEERAVRMAACMRTAADSLRERWKMLGADLGMGIGIASGFATVGLIGFEGRSDYAAIGTVTNQAARLCDAAQDGQILVCDRVLRRVETFVESTPVGELTLKGFHRPIVAHELLAVTIDGR
jgi:class 3 adenylate cyclase